jgi:rhodanese-related sulfurtransferase
MFSALFVTGFFDRFVRTSRSPSPTNAAGLAAMIDSGQPVLIVDVRTAGEYESGHIPSALNHPYLDIGNRPPCADKNASIIVYCRSGSRSAVARRTLESHGYTNVLDFGSLFKWRGSLVTGPEPR